MTDRRLTPANGRVADEALQGQVQADRFATGNTALVRVPVANLCRAPDGPRDRQVLLGAELTVYEDHEGWSFCRAKADGYCGYIRSKHLGGAVAPDHFVCTPATHAYPTEDIKAPELAFLPFGCRVKVLDERRKFFETDQGYIPKKHLRPIDRPFSDPVSVAQLFFGVPYLWGGNSTLGVDCSGLVQAGCHGAGLLCPGDSDLQQAALGAPTDLAAQRGDLVFWPGHVGWMVDHEVLLHANAHAMAVVYEPLDHAILRIEAQGEGPLAARHRL